MSILFYNIENDFQYSVRAHIEDSIFPDCREQMSEWAKPYIRNICVVNHGIVIALGKQSEPIGITAVPLPALPYEAGLLLPGKISSFMKVVDASSFCVIIVRESRRNLIPSYKEFCIGLALQTYFPEEFRELIIADNMGFYFRFLMIDGWIPLPSYYGDSDQFYYECIDQKFEQIETELNFANSINNSKLEAAFRKFLLSQLTEELKKIKK